MPYSINVFIFVNYWVVCKKEDAIDFFCIVDFYGFHVVLSIQAFVSIIAKLYLFESIFVSLFQNDCNWKTFIIQGV